MGGAPPAVPPTAAVSRPPARPGAAAAALRVLLTLPLVWGGALASGLAVYLVGLAVAAGEPGMSRVTLVFLALVALAVATLVSLACGLVLDRPRRRMPGLVVTAGLAAGALAAVVVGVLVGDALPVLAAAGLLGYAAVVSAALQFGASRTAVSPSVRAGGGARATVPPPVRTIGSAGARTRSSVDESTRQWSWDGPRRCLSTAGKPLWVLRYAGALAAAAAALLAGFVAFSLAAESFVVGQAELGWGETLLSDALEGPAGARALHIFTLALVNLGSGALFGVLLYAGARCAGAWVGRLYRLWVVVLAVLAAAGIAAWLLDGTLPK